MIKGNDLPVRDANLVQLRKEKGLTQEQVAEKIGCTVKTYRSWEKNGVLPNTHDFIELSRLFDVSTDYILNRTNYRKIEYGMASEITGLSERAVDVITSLHCGETLSKIIIQPEFEEIIEKLSRLSDNSELNHLEILDTARSIFHHIREGKEIPVDDRRDSLKYRIGTLFSIIVDRITSP